MKLILGFSIARIRKIVLIKFTDKNSLKTKFKFFRQIHTILFLKMYKFDA
jgi:hypothetical protein